MKDHSAVSKSMNEINKKIEDDKSFKLVVEDIKNKILTKV